MWNVLKNDDPKYIKIAAPEIPEETETEAKEKILEEFNRKKQV